MKQLLLVFAFGVLLLPMAEHKLHFIQSGQLHGYYVLTPDTAFSIKGWLSGRFQQKKEKYLNDNTGFRPDLIRLKNQIEYSLFDKLNAMSDIKGKNNCIYQGPYVAAYYGQDFVGWQAIHDKAVKLKAVQDTLQRLGKALIVAYLPNKASYWPEYIPDELVQPKVGMTNYKAYRQVLDSMGVNQADLEGMFLSLKNKPKEPLFALQCIHWTMYGAILGGDSLARYMERLTGITVEHPDWSEIEHSDQPKYDDDDLLMHMNLIFPLTKETLAYPIMKPVRDTSARKINAIYIGDSYMTKMVEWGILNKVNGQCEYWWYFNEVYDVQHQIRRPMPGYNWGQAIDRADCVVLAYTLMNLPSLGNGFIESAYNFFYPNGKKDN